jgi:hypothetical protein
MLTKRTIRDNQWPGARWQLRQGAFKSPDGAPDVTCIPSTDGALRFWPLAPVVVFALTMFRFVYGDVVGEPDLARVVFGILYDARNGIDFTPDRHYGLSFSFGYYWLLHYLLPDAVQTHASALIRATNLLGFASAVGFLLAIAALATRLYGAIAATIAVMAFAFSPMFMELAMSGHPLLPATALAFGGGLLLPRESGAHNAPGASRNAALASLAGLLLLGSLTVRAETALALPWLVLAGTRWSDRAGRQLLALRGATAAIAVAIFLVLQHSALGTQQSSGEALENYLDAFYAIEKIGKGLIMFPLAFGAIATVAAITLPFFKLPRLRFVLFDALLLIVPALLLWLPNPQPVRHFFFALLGMALLLGSTLPLFFQRAEAAILAALLMVAGHQVIIELGHATIVSRYQWNYPMIGARRSTFSVPLGFFPFDHAANALNFRTFLQEAERVSTFTDQEVVVVGEELHYILLSLVDSAPGVRVTPYAALRDSYLVERGAQRFRLLHGQIDSAPLRALASGAPGTRIFVQACTTTLGGWRLPAAGREVTIGADEPCRGP